MLHATRAGRRCVGLGLGRCLSSTPTPSLFHGVWPIMATPFQPDESLDLAGFAKAIRFMGSAGADGVTVVGVLGESNRITDTERMRLISCAVEAAGSVGRPFPVCVGTSHSGTAATVALSQMAQELGAAAVMVTPSKEASGNWDDALLTLYARVAAGCPGLPIVLQDHPASTGVLMPVPLLAKIVAEVPSVGCIKLESLPTPAKIAALRASWAKAPPAQECTILTGLGALYAGFDMEQGTQGFMTGFAFPEVLNAMNNAAQAGDLAAAHALYQRFLPLMVFEQQPGVAVRKELYRIRGLIESNTVRHPANAIAPALATALQAELARALPGVDLKQPLPAELFAGR